MAMAMKMSLIAAAISKHARLSSSSTSTASLVVGVQRSFLSRYSSESFDGDGGDQKIGKVEEEFFDSSDKIGKVEDEFFDSSDKIGKVEKEFSCSDKYNQKKPVLEPHTVNPSKGWGFRGVHKAIICGKIGQLPVQKILRNGRTMTIFTVGTGGMRDQRISGNRLASRPAQWHRIVVHNKELGAYAVRQLVKNSSVYVEGSIETRVHNDSINGQVKNIPEICVRADGKVRLIKGGEKIPIVSFNDMCKFFYQSFQVYELFHYYSTFSTFLLNLENLKFP